MIHKFLRQFVKNQFPKTWERLVIWKSQRAERPLWLQRVLLVQSCPDNSRIERVKDAGRVKNGLQTMHNGIRVLADSYYGRPGTKLIAANRGCHEPQEEVAFAAVLKSMPDGACMMELGAYWGFYSLWFAKTVQNPHVFLVEPDPVNLLMGEKNFRINGVQGSFIQGYVSAESGVADDGRRVVNVDGLVAEKGIEHMHILHSDIQGFEHEMLHGASDLIRDRKVDYLFISTHSMELHRQCRDYLSDQDYQILTSVTPEESYSVDGILVAHSPLITPPEFVHPSRRVPGNV